jgi:hypothetical protein
MAKTVRSKIYGPKVGYCNICQKIEKLTWDHIPPKGCAHARPVEIRSLTQHYSKVNTKFRHSQKGLSIRSLCAKCNNERLGKQYDPYLIELTHEVRRHLSHRNGSIIILPPQISFIVKPQRIARAIIGHLLAGFLSNEPDNKPLSAPIPDSFRSYFLDPHASMPKELDIYYWLYPSNVQAILKNIAILGVKTSVFVMGDVLKFFPLAYWAVWDTPRAVEVQLPMLLKNKDIGIDDYDEISIDFVNLQRYNWPETPNDDGIVLYRDESAMVAKSYINNKQKSNTYNASGCQGQK